MFFTDPQTLQVDTYRWNFTWGFAICGYLLLVRLLRYRRRDSWAVKLNYPDRVSLARMTLADAHTIKLSLAELEFPTVFSTSVFFAIFKTYGIPSISSLLVSTGQLSDPTTASKRAADTGVIITEVVLNDPASSRAIDATARMNYLHSRYIKAGKITNDDMLYTLSLFVLEPIRWTAKYEWRALTNLERCAHGFYWKSLGESMGISYEPLGSNFANALQWLEELEEWSVAYEVEYMVPAKPNAKLANSTLDIALFNVPPALTPTARNFAISLLEPRLRKAMLLKEPPSTYPVVLNLLIGFRKLIVKHCFLPQPYFMRTKWFSELDPQTGRAHFLRYVAHPWYIEPSLASRWGLKAWALWLAGGLLPGDEKYAPQGYKICDLGPRSEVGKGEAEMERIRGEIRARMRCSGVD